MDSQEEEEMKLEDIDPKGLEKALKMFKVILFVALIFFGANGMYYAGYEAGYTYVKEYDDEYIKVNCMCPGNDQNMIENRESAKRNAFHYSPNVPLSASDQEQMYNRIVANNLTYTIEEAALNELFHPNESQET